MMLGLSLHTVLVGAVDLLVVSVAVERLDRDEAYSGWLIAAFGLGGTVALVLGVALVGRRRIAPWVVVSGAATGLLLAGSSLFSSEWPTLAVLCACGGAAATHEVASLMLLQRVTRLDLLGHVFGAVEGINMAMLAIGAQVASLGVHWFGASGALVVVGMVLTGGTLALGPAVIAIDRRAQVPVVEMATIRRTPIFALLPGRALETLARESSLRDIGVGQRVIEQGQPGQEFFVVVEGALEVTIDGRFVRTLERGDSFGEIALIHDVDRTATITARGPSRVLALGRAAFLTAVAGHASSSEQAAAVAAERMADDAARGISRPI